MLRAVGSAVPSVDLQAPPVTRSDSSPGQSPAPSNSPQQPATPPSSTPAQTPSADKPSAGSKLRRHKKKTANASTCADSTTATTGEAKGTTGEAKGTTGAPATPADPLTPADGSAAKTAPVKCPPPKTVVHNGGTIEPAIQITSGVDAEKASSQRWTTDQLVGSTEENLKKISGRQMNTDQQEMLNQIHQFLDQSKAAIDAGDIERAHNLAMKARLLSDELAKP
jgi:hypothetical protein